MRLKINSYVLHLSHHLRNYFGKFLLYMGYNQYDHYITKTMELIASKPLCCKTVFIYSLHLFHNPTQISSNEKADKDYIAQKSCS